MSENIKLEYALRILLDDDMWVSEFAEVFTDEQGIQWVKFFPENGYYPGKEHMIRTDRIMIVRN